MRLICVILLYFFVLRNSVESFLVNPQDNGRNVKFFRESTLQSMFARMKKTERTRLKSPFEDIDAPLASVHFLPFTVKFAF